MNKTISTLEKYGLVFGDRVPEMVFGLPLKEVRRIKRELDDSVTTEDASYDETDVALTPFNFLASASFRGDSGCQGWECRFRKIQLLARYAAFFCDRVLVPLNFGRHMHRSSEYEEKLAFVRGVLSILELRPLIERSVVVLVPSMSHYCPICFKDAIPSSDQIVRIADELLEENLDRFNISYEPSAKKGKVGALVIDGPVEYVEHGHLNRILRAAPDWLPEAKNRIPIPRLSENAVRKSKFIQSIIWQISLDVAIQQVLGVRFNARYLTDRAGEAIFMSRMSADDKIAARTATLCAQLTHSVPLFAEIPLERVMRIREQDFEAFLSYRATLGNILKEHVEKGKELSEKEAREIYGDILEPEVLNLRQQAANERASALKKSVAKIGITAAVVGIGVHSGVLPEHLTELCKAVGGVKLVSDMAEVFATVEKNPTKVRNHNLYFLLRLTEETR